MKAFATEEERIRRVYRGEDRRSKEPLYRWYQPDVMYSTYRYRTAFVDLCVRKGWLDLADKEILDVGCGNGEWIRSLLEAGASTEKLHGIDLLEERIVEAKRRSPSLDFRVASAWPIPFGDQSIDLCATHTVFSSITDPSSRLALAKEMSRVTRADGAVLVWDFWVKHPQNPNTVGITRAEVKRLFPGHRISIRRRLLAPPLLRRTAPLSPLLALGLEVFVPFLRTHVIYWIEKP